MQFKLAFVAATLATLAVATPTPTGGSGSTCSTGPVQCCQKTTTVADLSAAQTGLLTLLGVVIGDLTNLVGFQCTNLVGSTCATQSVCCTNNAIGGLVSVGCIPIQL